MMPTRPDGDERAQLMTAVSKPDPAKATAASSRGSTPSVTAPLKSSA